MRPDPEHDGLTPVEIWPPYTAQEQRELEWETDPRRDWPTRREAEEDDPRRPVRCGTCEEEP